MRKNFKVHPTGFVEKFAGLINFFVDDNNVLCMFNRWIGLADKSCCSEIFKEQEKLKRRDNENTNTWFAEKTRPLLLCA